MSDVDVVHDHPLTGPLYRSPPARTPVVTTAHGPFDATLSPVYRAMRGVAVVAISYHQAAAADGVPLAGVIHHGLDVESVPVGRGNGGAPRTRRRSIPRRGPPPTSTPVPGRRSTAADSSPPPCCRPSWARLSPGA